MQYKTLVLTTYWSGWTKSRCASANKHKWNTEYLDSAFYKMRNVHFILISQVYIRKLFLHTHSSTMRWLTCGLILQVHNSWISFISESCVNVFTSSGHFPSSHPCRMPFRGGWLVSGLLSYPSVIFGLKPETLMERMRECFSNISHQIAWIILN